MWVGEVEERSLEHVVDHSQVPLTSPNPSLYQLVTPESLRRLSRMVTGKNRESLWGLRKGRVAWLSRPTLPEWHLLCLSLFTQQELPTPHSVGVPENHWDLARAAGYQSASKSSFLKSRVVAHNCNPSIQETGAGGLP